MEELWALWRDLVIGGDGDPLFPGDPVRSCFHTLLQEGSRLVKEWGGGGLDERASPATDEEVVALLKRSLAFIRGLRSAAPPRDRFLGMFFSPPVIMRERRDFNCVGASVLGMASLIQANLSWYCALAPNHVLLVVRLPSTRWCYVDFANGVVEVVSCKELELEEGGTALCLEQRIGFFRTIVALPPEYLVHGVLGNCLTIKRLATEKEFFVPGYEKESELARVYYDRYKDTFDALDFYGMCRPLFPLADCMQSSVMKRETKIVHEFMEAEGAYHSDE